MKKLVYLFTLICVMMIGFTSCNSCKNEKQDANDNQKVDSVLVVEDLQKQDAEQMTKEYGKDYRWYETCVTFAEFFDGENATEPVVNSVSNIYQYLTDVDDNSADVHVVLFAHVKDTTAVEVKHGFWVGDCPMTPDMIKVSCIDAYNKMMQANLPKPHSRQCVLRKEVGPKDCNPQYIFGNAKAQVYVDAMTGAVTDKNPVYEGFEGKLKKPLGEWP